MNTGVISSRYARSLLRYAQETGNGEQVCRQAQAILDTKGDIGEPLCDELRRFFALLEKNHREQYLKFSLVTFIKMYYDSMNISIARLTVCIPSEKLENDLRTIIEEKTGRRLHMEVRVDPELIGGFILDLDNYRLDASVKGQIESIRRQFEQKNKRIV